MTVERDGDRRRARRMEHRRRAILDAAALVFSEVGYQRATLENIGEAVGLSKTSLYYYVDSKEELLALLLVDIIDEIEAERGRRSSGAGDPIDDLRAIVTSHVVTVCTHPAGRVLGENLDVVLGESSSKVMRDTRQRYVAQLVDTIQRGLDQGVLDGVNPPVLGRLVLGALNTIPRWYAPAGPAGPEEIADQFVRALLEGVRTPQAAVAGGAA